MRNVLRTWLLVVSALAAVAGCGGSSSAGSDRDGGSLDAGADAALPDDAIAPDDGAALDAKPVPDAASDAAADAPTPEDVSADTPPADTPDAVADDATPPCETAAAPLLAEAKSWLERAQPRRALELYEEAEAACPDSIEARFGAALAGTVDAAEIAFSLVSLVQQGSLFSDGFTVGVDEDSQDEWFAEQLHFVFDSLAVRFRASLARLDTLVDADVSFTVDRVAVYDATRPLLVYRGTFDRGDVHLMRLVAQNVLFLLDVLATQDFRTELLTLIAELQYAGFDGVATVFEVLGRGLGGSPHFLTVHDGDGAAAYAEAGALLGAMGDTWAAALDHLRSEGGDGVGQVSSLHVTGAGDQVILAAGISIDADREFVETEVRFVVPEAFGAALDRLAASVATPGTLVPWDEGPTWLVGAWLVVAIDLGIVDVAALVDLPIPIGNLDFRSAAGLLGSLAPFPFAFDFGTLFANEAVGLRSFLPRANSTNDGVLIEWECPDETADDGLPDGSAGLLCGTATEDGPHFVGSDRVTTPDGILSTFPYLGFHDPTMNGLLYVDLEAIGLSETPGYSMADTTSLNAGLAAGLRPILDLLGR